MLLLESDALVELPTLPVPVSDGNALAAGVSVMCSATCPDGKLGSGGTGIDVGLVDALVPEFLLATCGGAVGNEGTLSNVGSGMLPAPDLLPTDGSDVDGKLDEISSEGMLGEVGSEGAELDGAGNDGVGNEGVGNEGVGSGMLPLRLPSLARAVELALPGGSAGGT